MSFRSLSFIVYDGILTKLSHTPALHTEAYIIIIKERTVTAVVSHQKSSNLAGDVPVVIGFDQQSRSWVTAKESSHALHNLVFPKVEGTILTDETSLAAASKDYGQIVQRRPFAVLRPASEEDIVQMIHFARKYEIQVAVRGQGHSTYGQSLVDAGIVIDMSSLTAIHEITQSDVKVDAGICWSDLLRMTIAQGLTPPTTPDYISLSVGGTLSVGGVGSQTPWRGPLVDNVLELEVVTGRGQIVTCSPTQKSELFDAVRAGLGQFGIITKARIRLISAPRMTRLYRATYDDLARFLSDMELLLDEQRFDTLQGFVESNEQGHWIYQLEVSKFFSALPSPNDESLLTGLSFVPGRLTKQDLPYFTGDITRPGYVDRVDAYVQELIKAGLWDLPHPWINLFVPSHTALDFIQETLVHTSLADVGQGVMSIYPYNHEAFVAPFFRVPATSHFFLFALLRNAVPPTTAHTEQLVALNRQLFERAKAAGGTRYPIDSVPMRQADWVEHFGQMWQIFVMFKQFFDPDNLFAPGQAIF